MPRPKKTAAKKTKATTAAAAPKKKRTLKAPARRANRQYLDSDDDTDDEDDRSSYMDYDDDDDDDQYTTTVGPVKYRKQHKRTRHPPPPSTTAIGGGCSSSSRSSNIIYDLDGSGNGIKPPCGTGDPIISKHGKYYVVTNIAGRQFPIECRMKGKQPNGEYVFAIKDIPNLYLVRDPVTKKISRVLQPDRDVYNTYMPGFEGSIGVPKNSNVMDQYGMRQSMPSLDDVVMIKSSQQAIRNLMNARQIEGSLDLQWQQVRRTESKLMADRSSLHRYVEDVKQRKAQLENYEQKVTLQSAGNPYEQDFYIPPPGSRMVQAYDVGGRQAMDTSPDT
jgi:hypothetical protein